MASGTITGSGTGVYCVISWSSTKGTGGSTVKATLYAQNASGWYWSATVNNGYYLTINGDKKSGNTAKLSSTKGGKATMISHEVWVAYTGEKSIAIKGYMNLSNVYSNTLGGYVGTRDASKTVALDKVGSIPSVPTVSAPTAATITEAGTTVTISWAKSTSYSGSGSYLVRVSVNGGTWTDYKTISSLSTTSTTYAIPAGQGKTYQFAVRASNDVGNSSWSYSGVLTTNSLSAPTIGTLNTYNPYVTSTLSVPLSGGSQTNGGAFKRMADLYYGDTLLASCAAPSNGNTTASITYAAANYASKLGTKAYSGTFKIVAWIQNGNGSRSGYVSKTFTVNLNSDGGATPSLSAPTFSGGALGYGSTCFIAGHSNLTVTSATASTRRAPSGTTLTYQITCNSVTKTGTSASFGSLAANIYTVTVKVTDSRGLSASVTKKCQFQSYANPTVANADASRLDNPNTSGKVTYTPKISPIYKDPLTSTSSANQINGISKQQLYVKSAWRDYTTGTEITDLDTESSYSVKIRVTDNLGLTGDSAELVIPTIKVALALRTWGIGINCIPKNGYGLDVVGDARVDGNITTTGSVSQSSDRRLKTDFREVNVDKYLELIKLLKPTLYKYIDGDGHDKLGLIAQDVESAMNQVGLTEAPFVLKDSKTNMYTLDYNQLGVLALIGVQKALSQ